MDKKKMWWWIRFWGKKYKIHYTAKLKEGEVLFFMNRIYLPTIKEVTDEKNTN